jgi:hypothetical protein
MLLQQKVERQLVHNSSFDQSLANGILVFNFGNLCAQALLSRALDGSL